MSLEQHVPNFRILEFATVEEKIKFMHEAGCNAEEERMGLEQHVPSRELCEEWKRRGGKQDTIFAWVKYTYVSGNVTWSLTEMIELPGEGEDWIAAPLVSEMMEWNSHNQGNIFKHAAYGEWCVYQNRPLKSWFDKSLPNALMQMLLERKEEQK